MAWQGVPVYHEDPNQQYYGGGQPGYPPNQGYPPPGGYPPPQSGGYPQGGGYPAGGYPPPGGGYPQGAGGYPQGGGYPPGGGYDPQPGFAPMGQQQGYGGTYDVEDGEVKGFGFSDESIRKAFIKKVYSILMIQLLMTFGIVCLFSYHDPTKVWVRQHSYLVWVALAVLLVTLIAMACCGELRRKSPTNLIFLCLFTLAEAFLMGVTSAAYRAEEVSIAIGITAAVCLGLTLFAFQTKWDFTVMGGVLFVALIVFMIFGIVAIFLPGKTMTLVYSSIGALLFSFYLIYDTQLMMGGKHKYSISPEEYVFAALNLYLDIINIFIYILSIIGASRD